MTDTGLATSLSRAVLLLEAMAKDGGLSFGEAAAAIRAVPSTAARVLRALTAADLAAHGEDGRYRVAARFQRVASVVTESPDLGARSGGCAEALAWATGESAAVFVPVDDGIRLVAKHEPPERFHHMAVGGVNRRCDRHGCCLLRAGWWDPSTARRRFAAAGGKVSAAWMKRVRSARRAGSIVTLDDDQPGIGRVAAAVVDAHGGLVAIVGVTATAAAVAARRESLLAAVREAAGRLAPRAGGAS